MKRRLRDVLGMLCLTLASMTAQAFDLADLRRQLQQAPVVRGSFVQQKILRGDAMVALTSRGAFTLASGHGLLWRLHSPVAQALRITPTSMARRIADHRADNGRERWQPLPQQGRSENRLFLSVLSGDTTALQKQFTLTLSGDAQDWQLRLTPNSAVLRQIFTDIRIHGGAHVARIELNETQGDATVVQLHDAVPDTRLTDAETQAFAD